MVDCYGTSGGDEDVGCVVVGVTGSLIVDMP